MSIVEWFQCYKLHKTWSTSMPLFFLSTTRSPSPDTCSVADIGFFFCFLGGRWTRQNIILILWKLFFSKRSARDVLQVNTKRGPPMVTKNNFWYLSIGLVLTYFFFKSNKKYIILSLFLSCLPEVSQTSIPLDSSTSTLPRYLTAKLHRPARTLSSSLSNLDDFFLVVFFDFFLPKFKDFLRDDDNCYSVKFFQMCVDHFEEGDERERASSFTKGGVTRNIRWFGS